MKKDLILENVSKFFGGVSAVENVSATFPAGRVTVVTGGNGAGKTTLFNLITGVIRPDTGEVFCGERRITNLSPWRTAAEGIGRLFQEVRVFKKMTVLENVLSAFPDQLGESLLKTLFRPSAVQRAERENRAKAAQFLEFVGLSEQQNRWAETLSHGNQKLLAIARLLASGSEVLLLDEPSAGVSPTMIEKIVEVVRRLAREGKTVVVIEHNQSVVEKIADQIVRMEAGRIVREKTDAPTKLKTFSAALSENGHGNAVTVFRLENVSAGYGAKAILENVSLELERGKITALFGLNGAGKSTLAKVAGGFLRAQSGKVFFENKDITAAPVHARARMGIGYLMQSSPVFGSLTARENLELAARGKDLERILELLPSLRPLLARRAGLLSGGQRQTLALAMTLAAAPRVLLLDEPSAGLAPPVVANFFADLARVVRQENLAALLVEQRTAEAAVISDTIFRTSGGKIESVSRDEYLTEPVGGDSPRIFQTQGV